MSTPVPYGVAGYLETVAALDALPAHTAAGQHAKVPATITHFQPRSAE